MPDTVEVAVTVPPPVVAAVTTPTPIVANTTIGTVGPAGPRGPAGTGTGDLNAAVAVSMASTVWVIPIPSAFIEAGKVPTVTVIDTGDNRIDGFGCTYDPVGNTLTLTFTFAFAGVAYLN